MGLVKEEFLLEYYILAKAEPSCIEDLRKAQEKRAKRKGSASGEEADRKEE